MRNAVAILCNFLFTALVAAQFGNPTAFPDQMQKKGLLQKPEFYILEWPNGTTLTETPTPLSIEIDSMGQQKVNGLVDTEDKIVLYVSDISTPVCADGDCRMMEIRLYWTLLGEYAGFDHYSELPLTKHDHDEFLKEDYAKLHQLLMDNNSILKRKEIDELVDKPKQPKMEGVDAVAGATIKEVKQSVVSGALYSCYTAWHLVHGEIKKAIKKRTVSALDDDLLLTMLRSDHTNYQLFALKRLTEWQYEENYVRIGEIFGSSIPLVRTFVIKNLPISFWNSEKLQNVFWEEFSKVDINSRSLLLDHLITAPKTILEDLSAQMKAMTKNQLKVFLGHLAGSNKISSTILDNLNTFSDSDNETNAYLVEMFLEEYRS